MGQEWETTYEPSCKGASQMGGLCGFAGVFGMGGLGKCKRQDTTDISKHIDMLKDDMKETYNKGFVHVLSQLETAENNISDDITKSYNNFNIEYNILENVLETTNKELLIFNFTNFIVIFIIIIFLLNVKFFR